MQNHDKYIKRCHELALNGLGLVAPNPMVGCVIVKGGEIISEGWHKKYGEAHAEVNAIKNLPDHFDYSDCELYVNLEPCSHHGKTPPCSDLIIDKKIKRVVIGNLDTNPLVAGKGIEKLKKAGIEVVSGVLEKEGRDLNKRFFTFHEKKRPYIILKWAQTANRFISRWPLSDIKEDNWITCQNSKLLVHEWRSHEQAIMIGTNTAINDNPELTVRHVKGNNPIRIVIDRQLKLDSRLNVFNSDAKTIVVSEREKENHNNISYLTLDKGHFTVKDIFESIAKQNISSVFVEGGALLLDSIIKSGLWDEARVFVNPNLEFKNGIAAPEFDLSKGVKSNSGTDLLYYFTNNS